MLVSAIEHYSYCPRQFALIHLEGVFEENVFTLKGHALHERVDEPDRRLEKAICVERALPIWSEQYGLMGKADVVEFNNGLPMPVEYKSGTKREHQHAALQLCAQAICLEEMFSCRISSARLYFGASRERVEVLLTSLLRSKTVKVVGEIRQVLKSKHTPEPVPDQRCKNCSLFDSCIPIAICKSKLQVQTSFVAKEETELP